MIKTKEDHPSIGWGYHRLMAKLESKNFLKEMIKECPNKSEDEIKNSIERAKRSLTTYYNNMVREHESHREETIKQLKQLKIK